MSKIEILSDIQEYRVFQHIDGYAVINLHGTCELDNTLDYPVIRVIDIERERVVIYQKLLLDDKNWQVDIRLGVGMYRLETGIALAQADYDPRYLKRGHIIRNIFVGEVYVIAGQSNAVGYGKDEVQDMPQYGVFMYHNSIWSIAAHPLGHMAKDEPNADYLNSGHSAWIALGKLILTKRNTPVGLVSVALNGSSIEMWAKDKALYKNMIEKSTATNARNIIWYQGCSDVHEDRYIRYQERLRQLIKDIKNDLGEVDITLIQLSGTTNQDNPRIGWQIVRESQRQVAVEYGLPLITTYDLINYSDDIHIGSSDNIRLANRVYESLMGKSIEQAIDVLKDDNGITLRFNSLVSVKEANISALDEDELKIPVNIDVKGNSIVISGSRLPQIKYISLPFDRLYNGLTIKDIDNRAASYFYIRIQ